jgi:hypothetical protein
MSVYIDEAESFDFKQKPVQKTELSPLSPHLFRKALDEDAPEDEKGGTNGARVMLQPKLSHKHNTRTHEEDADAPDDELAAPGSHYMPRSPAAKPAVRKINRPTESLRGQSLPNKFGQSVRSKRNVSSFQVRPSSFNNSDSETSQEFQEKKPKVKRRSKREEKPAPPKQEDMWSSFLLELADAEQQFFAPTKSQVASVFKYDDSDSSSSGEGTPPNLL